MIVADERAQAGLEIFELMGTQGFEMKNELLKCVLMKMVRYGGLFAVLTCWTKTGITY